MRITARLLREKRACEPDIAAFEKQWPDGCEVTPENCRIAFVELNMSPSWAADALLSKEAWDKYQTALTVAANEYWMAPAAARAGRLAWTRTECLRFVGSVAFANFKKARIEAFVDAATGCKRKETGA